MQSINWASLFNAAASGITVLALAACASGEKKETKTISDKPSEAKIAVQSSGPSIQAEGDGYRLITPSFGLTRNCTVVPITGHVISCESTFSGRSQIARSDGSVVTWNLVESWTKDGCDATEHDARWYKTGQNTDTVSYGWPTKDGESHHASAFLRFTNPGLVLTTRVRTDTCP